MPRPPQFYFEQKYLPQGIIDEWVEGMVSLIGLWHQPTPNPPVLENLHLPQPNANASTRELACRLFTKASGYPHLRHAFTITPAALARIEQARQRLPGYTADQPATDARRAQMVLEVLDNLQQYQQQPFYAYLRHRRSEAWGE